MRAPPRLEKWRTIVEALELDLTASLTSISAQTIKGVVGEEPRLMAKIDRREDLPSVFSSAGVFLLPVTNGEYVIVKGDGYHDLEPAGDAPTTFFSRLQFPLESASAGASETQHIDFAFNSGLIERFAAVGNLYLTIRGRKRAPEFDFRVGDLPIRASSVQVEVDAGFEAERHIVVLEGKIGAPDSFHIRQLYYPYRFWRTLVPEKSVIPIFFTYRPEGALSTFWEYRFRDPDDYLSIELVRSQSFTIRPASGNVLEPKPFRLDVRPRLASNIIPQADDVRKIAEFPFRVAEGLRSSSGIASYFEFDRRQSHYYRQAAEALDLVAVTGHQYRLTVTGAEYVSLPVQQRNELLLRQMLRLPVFNAILVELFLHPEKTLTRQGVAKVIAGLSPLNGDTLMRRAATAMAWLRWAERSVGVVHVDGTTVRLVGGSLL